jgi:hypothetical protein
MMLAVALLLPAALASDPEPDRLLLRGDVPPGLAAVRPAGAPDPDAPMDRLILALKPRPGAQADLDRLLADQADPRSPDYHRWLTPEAFGDRFGPTPEALDRTRAWLAGEGLAVEAVSAGRLAITFSGTVAQVERAFRTRIRTFRVDGRLRQGNADAPSIPRALADVVAGVVSLHDLPRRAQNTGFRPAGPALAPAADHPLTPRDFAIIYGADALDRRGLDGTGVSVAVAARTRIHLGDTATFRRSFGLPPRAPEVVVNGADPGNLGGDEEAEANLDVQWAGAAAPGATVKLVASASTAGTDGIDLSAQFIVNHNLAPVVSISFGQCEQRMGPAEQAFYKNLWAQAAAQGMTVLVAAGDSGPAGCDWGGQSASSGRAVNGLASTPYNLAVGGTQFHEGDGCYWKDTPDPDGTAAFRHIPERAWNESALEPGGAGLWATGGGTSTLYVKPGWQAAPGVPANGPQYQYRCLPDLALAAAFRHDGYRLRSGGAERVTGGTSCAAPAMAGLLARVVQATGERQGNAGPILYQLGRGQYRDGGPAVFHDITEGGSCVPGTQGWSARPGYDLATGLGSVDAGILAEAWPPGGAGPNVDALVTRPAADLTVADGTTIAFQGRATAGGDPGAALTCRWDFGDGDTAEGTAATHTYRNPGAFPVTNLVTFTAAQGGGARGVDTRTLTVLPPPAPGETITDGGFELDAGAWRAWGVGLGDNGSASRPRQGRANAWFPGGRGPAAVLEQTVTLPAQAASARLAFWLRTGTPGAADGGNTFQVKVRSADGGLATLGTWNDQGGGLGYQQATLNLGAYRGQTVQLAFVANRRAGGGGGFSLDDVSLLAPCPAP